MHTLEKEGRSSLLESGSSLGTFLDCPRKYEFTYIKKLSSPFYQAALGYGSLVHAIVEDFHRGECDTHSSEPESIQAASAKSSNSTPLSMSALRSLIEGAHRRETENTKQSTTPTATLSVLRQLLSEYPDQQESILLDAALALGVVAEWRAFWAADKSDLSSMVIQEAEVEWTLPLQNGIQVGKSDGRLMGPSGSTLYELKTSSAVSREAYKHRLEMDKQISANILAMPGEKTPLSTRSVLYDIIWKPPLKLKAGRKTIPDETREEFYDRILTEVRNSPSNYFERMMIFRSPKDLAEYVQDAESHFKALSHAYEQNYFHRNTNSCEKFGVLCPYFNACLGGGEHEEELFRKRARKLPEISETTQQER